MDAGMVVKLGTADELMMVVGPCGVTCLGWAAMGLLFMRRSSVSAMHVVSSVTWSVDPIVHGIGEFQSCCTHLHTSNSSAKARLLRPSSRAASNNALAPMNAGRAYETALANPAQDSIH